MPRRLLPQHISQDSRNDGGIKATPAEEPGQSPILHVPRKCAHCRALALGQVASRGKLSIRTECVERSIDVAAVDSLSLEFSPEDPTG
jgi:hypothetical protein